MDLSDSDSEVIGNEYEELCKNCDTLCKKLTNPVLPTPPVTGFKKDSRVWLHKNPGFKLGAKLHVGLELKEDSSSECLYSVMDMFGRKFKKDSRTWLHKSSRKRQRSTLSNDDEQNSMPDCKSVRSGDLILPNVPKRPPGPFIKRDPESPLKAAFRNDTCKQYFSVSNIIRKRKRRQQSSYSANSSPSELGYGEEICRILADEINGNNVRGTVSEEMFEIFDDDDESIIIPRRRQASSDHTQLSVEWRETRAITSETSTQSSNDNHQMSVNHSPLSSDASINISSEIPDSKRSPSLVSAHFKNNVNPLGHNVKIHPLAAEHDCDMTPPKSPSSIVYNQTDFSANSCCVSALKPLHIDSRKQNINSRSVCFLIAESDEFLEEDSNLIYESESEDEQDIE